MLGAANGLGLPRTHVGWQKPRWPCARGAYATSATPSFRPLVPPTTTSNRWRPWKSHNGRTQWLHRPCGAMLLYRRYASHNGHMDIIARRCISDTSIEPPLRRRVAAYLLAPPWSNARELLQRQSHKQCRVSVGSPPCGMSDYSGEPSKAPSYRLSGQEVIPIKCCVRQPEGIAGRRGLFGCPRGCTVRNGERG